jgi:DNA-binding Lrp family transcriptional regulator
MFKKLDKTDKRIIEMLLENCRRPFREIADEVGLSESTVRKRVIKLQEEGIISKFTICLNPDLGEKKIQAFLTVLPKSENLKDLIRDINPYPELTEIYSLAGKCGLLIKANVSDLTELDALIETFKARTDVEQVESVCVVLRSIKEDRIP